MAKVIRVMGDLSGTRTDVANLPAAGFKVKSGTTSSIKKGYLVIKDGSNAGYAKAAADGTASTSVILGIATGDSNETASADGNVNVAWLQNLVVEIFANTPGSLATSKLLSQYTLKVSGGSYLLDEATTTNGFIRLLDYDNTTNGKCTAVITCNT